MRLARLCSATLALALMGMSIGPVYAQADLDGASKEEARNGPFVTTDLMLGDLLDQGFEIKGILGGALVLVRDAKLYSCALVPDHAALSYKTQFECSVLDEIRSTPPE